MAAGRCPGLGSWLFVPVGWRLQVDLAAFEIDDDGGANQLAYCGRFRCLEAVKDIQDNRFFVFESKVQAALHPADEADEIAFQFFHVVNVSLSAILFKLLAGLKHQGWVGLE